MVNEDHVRYRKGRKFLPQIIETVMDRSNTRRFLPPLYKKHIRMFSTRRKKYHLGNLVFPEPSIGTRARKHTFSNDSVFVLERRIGKTPLPALLSQPSCLFPPRGRGSGSSLFLRERPPTATIRPIPP